MALKWHFDDETGMHQGPNNATAEHFKYQYASLVREAIQNALDAVNDTKHPVQVEINFGTLKYNAFPNFFDLKKHIEGCYTLYPDSYDKYHSMLSYFGTGDSPRIGYMKISDKNTKGMPYEENNPASPFYAFVRSFGVSAKGSEEAGGSFGFGKAAYYNCSPINTVLVSTLTPPPTPSTKGQYVFEGAAVLCTHKISGKLYSHAGFFDATEGKPTTDPSLIEGRFKRDEPGTSFFIMGFDQKKTKTAIKEMKAAVLRNFWLAIWENKLTVKFEDEEVINHDNLQNLLECVFDKPTETHKKSKNYTLKYNPRPYFQAVANAVPDEEAETSDTSLKYTDNLTHLGEVELYLYKNPAPQDRIIYMREQLMLIYSEKEPTSFGYNAVFVCKDPNGNNKLRKLENPRHDQWDEANWTDPATQQIQGEGKLILNEINDFIQKAIEEAFNTEESEETDIAGLEDYLYIPGSLIEEDESKSNKETESGNPAGEPTGQDGPINNHIENPEPTEKTPIKPVQSGVLLIEDKGKASKSKDGGEIAGTNGDKKTKKNGGHSSTKGHNIGKANIDKNDEGKYLKPLNITSCRSAAQNENGEWFHFIMFHSGVDTEQAELKVEVFNDDGTKEKINIDYTDNGKAKGCWLQNVTVKQGSNRIKIQFADNIKHAITLKAYESYEN